MKTITKYRVQILFLLVMAVQAVWIWHSDGFYFIDDSCHFNYNRHFIETYNYSIGSWHRIGRVWLFAIPAQFGLKGVQIASALLFLLTIYICYRILKHKNVRYAEWVIPIAAFQPVLFNISYTTLAELPAAFLIVLSYYFYLKDKYKWVMLSSSLIFIFRTEFYFVAGLFLLIYLYQKKWKALLLFLVGPLIWYLYSTIISWSPNQFFYDMALHSRLPRIEEGIDWFFYLVTSPKIYGFVQTLFFIVALIYILASKTLKEYAILLLIIFGGIAVHTLLAVKGLNLSCSIGQLRYVAIVGPAFAIISTVGISWLYEKIKISSVKVVLKVIFLAVMFFSLYDKLCNPYGGGSHDHRIFQFSTCK